MNKKSISLIVIIAMMAVLLCGCAEKGVEEIPEGNVISISDESITYNGTEVGTETAAVYVSNDVIYYEDRDTYDDGFTYGEGEGDDKHSAEEAAACTVVNITESGTYRISGKLSEGQIRVDLGEEAVTDPKSVVTLVLDNVDISCSVAPAVLFMNVYECDGEWSTETATGDVDTSAAGANIVIEDGSINNINGSHVAKIFKDNADEKKLWKQDGAFYSYMSMNIDGNDGILNINGDNEGLDTELHLPVNGGVINITSRDDGMNTNEDGVSVTTINGGTVHILGGLGAEGDGIDSNGWLVINGGTVIASANPASDSGLDSDMGSYINGGTVVAFGSTMDWAESDSKQVTVNLQFSEFKNADDAIVIRDESDGSTVFSFNPAEDEVLTAHARQYMGAIISCPEFEVGAAYNVYVADVQQVYTGTDVKGGAPGGMEPPDAALSQMMPKPDDAGNNPPEKSDGKGMGNPPEKPDGVGMGNPPEKPQGGPSDMNSPAEVSGEVSESFLMQDKVNCFSGIRNAE